MFNYLRSEFYRNIRQRGWQGLLLFIFCFAVLIAAGLRFIGLSADQTERVAQVADRFASVPFLLASLMNLALVIFMISFATISLKEKPIHIQMISFGLKREQIYFGDFIMQSVLTILTALFTVLVLFAAFGLLYVSVPGIAEHLPETYWDFALSYLRNVPLYVLLVIAINTTMQFFYQIIKKGGWAIVAAFVVNMIFPAVWQNLMGYEFIQKLFFSEWVGKLSPALQVEQLFKYDFEHIELGFVPADIKQVMICFVVVTALFLAAGYLHYRHEEL